MEVVRRNDSILLTSKKRSRSILLKFPSVRECIEFSDELLRLNRPLQVRPMTAPAPLPEGAVTPGASQKSMKELLKEEETSTEKEVTYLDPLSVELQRNDVNSYLVRLLHDESFIRYTHKIEEMMSDDTARILQAASTNIRYDDETSK